MSNTIYNVYFRIYFLITEQYTQKDIILLLKTANAPFNCLLLMVIFNREYFPDNTPQIYSSKIWEKHIIMYSEESLFC